MSSNNQNSNGGGCFGFIVMIVILAFVIKGCGGDSNKDVPKDITPKTTIEKSFDSQKDDSVENQKKFVEAGNKFYDMYIEYFGEDFSIDEEPFENGEYKGDNREKYSNLATVLDDMCMYYNGIKKQSDRYDALGELPLSMYDYTYYVRQMMTLIEGIKKYDDEKFTLEYSDYIVN